jgi:zinc protease
MNSAIAGVAIESWTQASGVQVFLVQSHAIPMLDVQIEFDAGSRRDPVEKAGLSSVTASLSGMGVLANALTAETALDENALGEAWADLGASFVAHTSADRMSFSLRSLTYPDLLDKAVQLAARQLAEPAFAADIWQRERESMSAALKEADTRASTQAGRAFNKAVYADHPYGFAMTPASLARISVPDMQALYQASVQPCRAKVSLVGALKRPQADALVTALFARLVRVTPTLCTVLPNVPEVAALSQAIEQRIAFESAQAHVLVGQPGFKRDDPDFFALTVGNYILGGGGFVSRLTTQVREKRGLSYSVYSYFEPGLHAGAFTLGLQTRPDQAEQALQVSRDVLASFVANGPTLQELQAAKDNLIGGFALRLDSNRKLLDNVSNIAWNRLPLNYLDTWTQQIEQVTLQQIRSAFARKLQPEKMVTVILGGTQTP